MSFSPIDFIFIGCIGYDDNFCWVLRNFDFKPANEIFSKKGEMSFFQKTCFFGGMTSKIEFEQNWCYGYVLYYGFGSNNQSGRLSPNPPPLQISPGPPFEIVFWKVGNRKKKYTSSFAFNFAVFWPKPIRIWILKIDFWM